MTQFLLWIIPPIFYFLAVMFFRGQVNEPHVPRIAYLGTIFMLIPFVGLLSMFAIVVTIVIAMCSGDIEFKEDTKFYKKWLD